MNFIKRAWLNLIARKSRSLLLILVTGAIMLFVMAGLLIKSAAGQAVANAKASVGATITLTANRQAAFKKMRSSSAPSGQPGKRPSLTLTPVKLSTAKQIAKLNNVSGYSIAVSAAANAKSFDAISTTSSSSQGPGGMAASTGDISISGVSSTSSSSSFADGTDKITQGRGLKTSDIGTNHVVIESELATQNSLKVGDAITVKATSGTKKTHSLKIVGIYKAKSTATAGMGPGASDPANTIFTSYTLANTHKGSKYQGTADSVVFTVSAPSQVAAVKKQASKLVSSKYSLSLDDQNYQMVKSSMSSVTSFADKVLWLVAIAGTIILALIVILMIRERRYEIGILMAMGESRFKIIAQFFVELFVVLLVGVGIAAAGGAFVGNKLAAQVTASASSTSTGQTASQMLGGKGGAPSGQAPAGGPSGQMLGSARTGAATQQKQTKLAVKVTAKDVALLFGLGLAIILLAILAAAAGILRLQPKMILIQ
ncbi:ABC transporter permease [Lacticaseibacillus sp. 866-1]|uniref:ABC transporter permease n=1 Tax=Lacticaseibacillus sp. 866-1 TaxID=2799576 RepID=UPI001941EA77|nr:ABC transporter permease [Lacticaseibacillus sp. 866-1]